MKLLQIELQKKINVEINDGIKTERNFLEYYQLFGLDDFAKEKYPFFAKFEKPVLVVNMDASSECAEEFIKDQKYRNIECVKYAGELDSLISRNVNYVCFIEKNHIYNPWKIVDMVLNLRTCVDSAVICYRNFKLEDGTVIKDYTCQYWEELKEITIEGKKLIEMCVNNRINLYGDLSTILCKIDCLTNIEMEADFQYIENVELMYEIMLNSRIHFMNRVLTYKNVDLFDEEVYENKKDTYIKFLSYLKNSKGVEVKEECGNKEKIKKEITFFYTDSSEYFNLAPIADYAEKEGYKVQFSKNVEETAEIGVYCQHECHPENSKFSMILLHDMAQRHDIWPNIWMSENWDKFDIGILPGKQWEERWATCALAGYARPRLGVYALGYPKSDMVFSEHIIDKGNEIKKYFKYDFTVLYAPSWENDGKEDDFVRNLNDLPINLLVKQVPVTDTPQFQFVRDNIAEMRRLHDNKYENLHYIEPDENILVALALCDMVVSDESSVMTEATMYGKPSLAITDWLIPDRTPSRYACVPTNYVLKCQCNEMRDMVLKLLKDKMFYKKTSEMGKDFFSNQGHCCEKILNLLDEYIDKDEVSIQQARSKYEIIDMWN
jgi:hypothetical protein